MNNISLFLSRHQIQLAKECQPSTTQVLFLVSIVVSLTLLFFLDEGIRCTYLHDKFLGVGPL